MTVTAQRRWSGCGLGLDLVSDFELPGLSEASSSSSGRVATRLSARSEIEIVELWPAVGSKRISERAGSSTDVVTTIDSHPTAGFLFRARDIGSFHLTIDADELFCSPPAGIPLWTRYLIGQVLPFASLLRGLEVFHASAVRIGDQAVAFLGSSGAGKSTLALNLHRLGAGFITDDVLAVADDPWGALAQPGLPLSKVRHAASDLLVPGAQGNATSYDDGCLLAVRQDDRPSRLGAAVFLNPDPGRLSPSLRPLAAPDPELLLQATFNFVLDTPTRLLNQLAVCATVCRTARILICDLPARPGPTTARALNEELRRMFAAPSRPASNIRPGLKKV